MGEERGERGGLREVGERERREEEEKGEGEGGGGGRWEKGRGKGGKKGRGEEEGDRRKGKGRREGREVKGGSEWYRVRRSRLRGKEVECLTDSFSTCLTAPVTAPQ